MHDAKAHNQGDAGHDICDRGDGSLHQLPQRPDAVPSRPAFVEISGRRKGGDLIKKLPYGLELGWSTAADVGGGYVGGGGLW